ncbi:MAG: ABC transporter permease [Reichenbachiella sp.]
MNKVGLIIIREYLSRVKKKSFVIMTILGPILFSSMFIIPIWLATRESSEEKVIQVIDESGIFNGEIQPHDKTTYLFVDQSLEDAKKSLTSEVFFGLLYIPKLDIDDPKGIQFISTQNPGISVKGDLEWKIKTQIENIKLVNSGLDKSVLDNLKADVFVQTINLSETGEESESSAGAATAVGYIGAFLIYFFIFLYGAQIMRGIIEEKTSRIIEVVIASVRPFQLMMGKIIGIASVGLTQFLLWVLFSIGIVSGLSAVIMKDVDPQQIEQALEESQSMSVASNSETQEIFKKSMGALDQINIPLLLTCFVFYFLAGYLFYGALFAAVGSAVDSDADSQQFMLPITIPLIVSIAMISVVINEPHGNMSFWLSIIPFTSPVIMMMRLPFDVQIWELLLSMILLIVGFGLTTWFASRIYRIGIFMHGTKVNYKTLAKWFMMKN